MLWVFVNGVAVIADGKMTGARPGKVLRGPGYGTGAVVSRHRYRSPRGACIHPPLCLCGSLDESSGTLDMRR
jgi:hypothetical protein